MTGSSVAMKLPAGCYRATILAVLVLLPAILAVSLVSPSQALGAPLESAQAPSGRPIPTDYEFPVVRAPTDTSRLACLQANPSCIRDPWWVEWNELQSNQLVQFEFVKPGLVSEARFIEALWLLWKWPEGQFLLREAGEHGVLIRAAALPGSALAAYRPWDRTVGVNSPFVETSTWMVADVLGHELKHAADDRAGSRDAATYQDCIAREQVAYQVEWRYLRWLNERFVGIPGPYMVASRLSGEDSLLYMNLYSIATSPNVNVQAIEDYRKNCSVFL